MAKQTSFKKKWMMTIAYSSLISGLALFTLFQLVRLVAPDMGAIWRDTLITVLMTIFTFGLSGFLLFKDYLSFERRLEQVTIFIRTLTRGKLSHRATVDKQDEVAQLEGSLNQLADDIEQQVTSLQKLADEKESLATRAKSAAAIEERQRLARDLHDAVSQQLFALSMMASAANKAVDKDIELAKQQITDIRELSLKAMGEMRALLLHLRPVHLSNDSLYEGVCKLMNELSEKTNIQFNDDIDDVQGLSAAMENHLFRILQEALSNALRHSEANQVKLQLYKKDRTVFLQVRDNGKGFEISENKLSSYGMRTMKERCEELGGKMTVTSQKGEGTAVEARLPIQKGEAENV
ncbi:sensor histidine kinase [Tuberibacillus sp. Marseille-P3662]|uniref:sensor histidine kinase n=1 Tax=Tuberibacillus sp. Marseille-P3662 TaxID=1965358 RepID=UPI000A1CA2B0|nr:sensor histidine kinase [Tuberibacillus sp. Marseille-P3662]